MKQLAALTLLFISCCCLQAQPAIFTVDSCMRYAMANSPRCNRQVAQNRIYKYDYQEAIAALLPSVSAQTSASLVFGRSLDGNTNTYTDVNSFNNSYGASASLNIFSGLTAINRIRMQKATTSLGKSELEQSQDMVAYETAEAFYNALYAKGAVDVAEQQLSESSQLLKQMQRMEELGIKSVPDVLNQQAQYSADVFQLTRRKNEYAISMIVLKERMNFPIDEDLRIEDNSIVVLDDIPEALDVYNMALAYNPTALAAEQALRVQQIRYQVVKGTLFPTISAYGGWGTSFFRLMGNDKYDSFSKQLRVRNNYNAGVSLRIPIFNNGGIRALDVKRSRQQVRIAEAAKEEKLRTFYAEIEQAIADLKGLMAEYDQAKKQVESMQAAHNANQHKYTEGLLSIIELNMSVNNLQQAQLDQLNVGFRLQLKQRLVRYYLGQHFVS